MKNPLTERLDSFLTRKPNITLLGVAWALHWRITLFTWAIIVVIVGIVTVIGSLV
jgi:hypothetical protein